MPRYPVHVDYNPHDPGEDWPHTAAGAQARLKECEAGMERERGERINLGWYYWSGEWGIAWEWLQKRCPKIAARLVAESEARTKEQG